MASRREAPYPMTSDERDRRDWNEPDAGERSADEPPPDDSSTDSPLDSPSDDVWAKPQAATDPVADDTQSWDTPAPEPHATHEPPPSEVEAYLADAVAPASPDAAVPAHSVPESQAGMGESTLCPRCGTENKAGLAFCRNCGQRLAAAGVAPILERPGTPEGTTACPRCGTHNREGVAFCQNCGANLHAVGGPGYVPPAVSPVPTEAASATRRFALLGPVVLLVGVIGLVTGYLLPFAYGTDSLLARAWGEGGYSVAFWNGYSDVSGSLADQAYFGFAAPVPILVALIVVLALAGIVRAAPGMLQVIGLVVSLLWSAGLVVLFVMLEVVGNWEGDLVGLLSRLSSAGIIFFLSGLIVLIGALTRFARA